MILQLTGRSERSRSYERINNLIRQPTDQGAKTRKEQPLCFLCAFYDSAPWREMLLLIQGLFRTFTTMSAPPANGGADWLGVAACSFHGKSGTSAVR